MDVICGATGCDPNTGDCIFPAAGTRCGPSHCTVSSESRGRCDGQGTCGPPVAAPCPGNFACLDDSSGCKNSCLTTNDCAAPAYCDLGAGASTGNPTGACCPPHPGGVIQVDNNNGSDGPCCGLGTGSAACATIQRAISVAREALEYGATLEVTPGTDQRNSNCTHWGDFEGGAIASEPFPIQLGYGVTVDSQGGPGLCFEPPYTDVPFSYLTCSGPYAVFQVSPFPEEDGGTSVTLRGSPPITIITQFGVPAVAVGQLDDPNNTTNSLQVQLGCFQNGADFANPGLPATVTLDGVTIGVATDVSPAPPGVSVAEPTVGSMLYVGPGSTLTLGPNPVQMSPSYNAVQDVNYPERLYGIYCSGQAGLPATVQDVATASNILSISPSNGIPHPLTLPVNTNLASIEIDIDQYCNVNLAAGPTLGGLDVNGNCNFDDLGMMMAYNSSLSFGSAALPGLIHCMLGDAIFVPGVDSFGNPLGSGGPPVQVLGATIRYNDGAGIHMQAGTLTTSDTQIVANDVGLQVDGPLDSYGNSQGPGAEGVTLGSNSGVACNGSAAIVQPVGYQSYMYAFKPPASMAYTNSGADLCDENSGITVSARSAGWTNFAAGATQVATCDSTCFQHPTGSCTCTCVGPNCPAKKTNGIPDGLNIVKWAGASVDVKGGSLLNASFCIDIANGGL
jgi:hypothetical protein